jgi:2-keto-3-deoxy-L-rhamnonate aldolase RhmA
MSRDRAAAQATAAAGAAGAGTSEPSYGLFICSGSPEIAEAMSAAAPHWLCLDAQHGAVPYDRLKHMLNAAGSRSKLIVRVGGPSDRYGIQQALE